MIKNLRDVSYAFFVLACALGFICFAIAGFETVLAMATDYTPYMIPIPDKDEHPLAAVILISIALMCIVMIVLLWQSWQKDSR